MPIAPALRSSPMTCPTLSAAHSRGWLTAPSSPLADKALRSFTPAPTASDSCVFDSLVYDDSQNDLVTRFDPGTTEVGDEIIFAGSARHLTRFILEYWGTSSGPSFAGAVKARLRFYRNNGPAFNGVPTPGSTLFDSGDFAITATTRSTLVFNDFTTGAVIPLTGNMPDSFTWRSEEHTSELQ